MEPTRDIAQAIATRFTKPLGTTTFVSELPAGVDNAYLVVSTNAPDATEWNGGIQIQNYQQFDIYAVSSKPDVALSMAYEARLFLGCLACLAQAISNPNYRIVGVKTIGGVTDLEKTAENKQLIKCTVQITYLAVC